LGTEQEVLTSWFSVPNIRLRLIEHRLNTMPRRSIDWSSAQDISITVLHCPLELALVPLSGAPADPRPDQRYHPRVQPANHAHQVESEHPGYVREFTGSPVLVVAFGGLANSIGAMPPFEFLRMLRSPEVDKLFVRDLRQSWYQRGVEGCSTDVATTAQWLRAMVETRPYQRVVTLGTSAGGFAALLFGAMLEVDHVLAFGPQTFLGPTQRARHADARWLGITFRMHVGVRKSKKVLDVAPPMRKTNGTQYEVHVGANHLDLVHARHLVGINHTSVHSHAGGHNVAKVLREQGTLSGILDRAVMGESGL